jgi:L-ascorbate metabolism protein UlaG (beta-lactamase superfamily)
MQGAGSSRFRDMATELTWLGHSAFRMESPGGKRIYVDPFLHGNPKCPSVELDPERCELVVLTHAHGDHVGDTVALAKRFGCPVVAQLELRGWLTSKGVADDGSAHSPNKGGTVFVEGIRVTLTDANHSSSTPDGTYAGEPCGVVLELEDGFKLYFAGDTNVFGDMSLIGRIYSPDVAVLPIGDHYTMGPREAAVALELLGVARCVPCHYGTFPLLVGTPDELKGLAPPGVQVFAPDPGGTLSF